MAVVRGDGACAAIINLNCGTEKAKNNLITENIELYPRAIMFYTHTHICNYFDLLEGLGRLAQLYFKFLLYAVNSKTFLHILFGSGHTNTADTG